MDEPTLAQTVAHFAVGVNDAGVPEPVSASVRERVLDVLGLSVAAGGLDTSVAIVDHVREQGGTAQAHVIGEHVKVPAAQAALANGVLAHSLDFDDTHLPSVLHPSASVVPAALAAAEYSGADGEDLIRAIAVGLETTVRLGMAGYDREERNSLFFDNGQHATSICGAIGSAVAAGMLLRMDSAAITDVVGLSVSMASGVIEANRTGGTVKRLHCGWAAHAAVSAAQLVRRGFSGPPTALEGRFGFFQAFLQGRFDSEAIVAGLGETWSVPQIFFKPYPANHFTHTIIDAGRELRSQGIDVDRIDRMVIGVPAPVVRTLGEPIDRKRRPQTAYEAQFSGPYAAVVGLLGGGGLGASVRDYEAALLTDPRRMRLMAHAEVVADTECTRIFPYQFPSVLRVHTDDGREWTARVLVNRGGPQNPLSAEELRTKFRENALDRLGWKACEAIERAVAGLGSGSNPSELFQHIHTESQGLKTAN